MSILALNGMSHGMTVLFTVLMGFFGVFLGMSVIIFFLLIIGKIFSKITNKKPKQPKEQKQEKAEVAPVAEDNSIDEKTRVAIISAIYMYYLQEENDCEFIVKKIRKI